MRSIAVEVARGRALWLLGVLSGAAVAAPAGDPALEKILRERHPDVQRWETRPMEPRNATPQAPVDAVGRIGARTQVRYADGRVRWFAVAGFAPALVTTRAIEANTTVDAGDVRLAERDIVGGGCEPLTALDAHTRWRATTRLSNGESLCARSIEAAPDVERARNVVLSAQRGGIEVSRVLVAADDARAGERVRLTDSSSGDVFVAVVTGAGTARAPAPGENP